MFIYFACLAQIHSVPNYSHHAVIIDNDCTPSYFSIYSSLLNAHEQLKGIRFLLPGFSPVHGPIKYHDVNVTTE